MNKKDLDALNELYSSVYDGEQLNEGPYSADNVQRVQQAQQGRDNFASMGGYAGLSRAAAASGDSAGAKKYMQKSQQIGDKKRAEASADSARQQSQRTQNRADDVATYRKAFGIQTPTAQRAAQPPVQKPKPFEYNSKNLGDKQNAEFRAGGGNAAVGDSYTAADVVARGRAALKAKAETASGGSGGSGGSNRPATRPAAAPATRPVASTSPGTPKVAPTKPAGSPMDQWRSANPKLAAAADEKARIRGTQQTDNPLMKDMRSNLPMNSPSVQSPAVAKLGAGNQSLVNNPNAFKAAPPKPAAPAAKPAEAPKRETQLFSYQWPSAKTIREIAGAYASIYEAKKKVDQDEDGDNDFADIRIARMIASGVPKAKAIAMVKNKSYNEEVELWVNELIEEGYDLSGYTWDDMFEIYLDEATRMRKELGKEGEIATRQELARRSNAYQRSGSVDRTIAAAERGAKNPYVVRGKNETEAEHNKREQAKSQTLTRLASNRRGSVRDKPRAGLRGYAAKVEGSDRDLQSARSSAMAAGTLTPREKKELNREAYAAYEFVASYLLENNFASTVDDANVIINNMSEGWFESIMEEKKPLPVAKMKRKESKLLDNEEGQLQALRTDVGSKERKARMKELQRFDNINSVRTSVAKRGGKQQHSMPEIGRYKSKDED
jgi:hypothetical protein